MSKDAIDPVYDEHGVPWCSVVCPRYETDHRTEQKCVEVPRLLPSYHEIICKPAVREMAKRLKKKP